MKFSTTLQNTVLGGTIDRKDDGGTYECVVTDLRRLLLLLPI